MLTENDIEYYIRAGWIACTIRKEVEKYVSEGVKLLSLAELIERRIVELGGRPAFPVNISLNSVAAHYTPTPGDSIVIGRDSVVKIDIGVHIDGYIADTSTTVVLSDIYRPLVEATKEALEKALAYISPNRRFSEIGTIIEKVAKDRGYKPIYNLSGHRIDRYVIHAGENIPNFNDRLNMGKFRLGCVYAIEPFLTNGMGFVEDTKTVTIYALMYNPKKIRKLSKEVAEVYTYIYSDRKTLPFAKRWYVTRFSEDLLNRAFYELSSYSLLTSYPVLIEKSGGVVAQFEHTVLINDRGEVIVTTDQC